MLRMTTRAVLRGLAAAVAIGVALPAGVPAEQASRPSSAAAGGLDVGRYHACAVLSTAGVRCWGYGFDGALGYASTESIGDDELPAAAGPVDLGAGRTAVGLSAGFTHTCAVLDDRSVRCWGFGADGQLGYGNTNSIGDDETPGAAGSVNLGTGRSATAVTAGRAHSCAVLDDATVRCWGFGFDGRLGYGNNNGIGDPGAVGPVKLGAGRTARAITAGDSHTCALLDDGAVRCWGYAGNGQLGYGNSTTFSDTETPDSAGPVVFPTGRTAVAISAGSYHTCVVLDDGTVRCWGYGGNGRLGYGATFSVGDNEPPASLAPVALGAGRTAVAISAGADHTCAVLDNGAVRCWGAGRNGQLGYANTNDVGDDESPGSVGPVDLGPGRRAIAISAGSNSTCARLDDASVRCWGDGANGLLGICNTNVVGDDETPASSNPVALGDLGLPGPACAPPAAPTRPGGGSSSPLDFGPSLRPPPPPPGAAPPALRDDGLAAQSARARALRDCRSSVSRRMRAQQRRVRSRPPRVRAIAIRQIISRAGKARRACLKRFARRPGRVTAVSARATSRHAITLTFNAAGTDGTKPPAARRYLIKQSLRPLRTARDVRRAPSLCRGACNFDVSELGAAITLNVTDLRRRRTYHYAVAARDNVSGVRGPYSKVVSANTG